MNYFASKDLHDASRRLGVHSDLATIESELPGSPEVSASATRRAETRFEKMAQRQIRNRFGTIRDGQLRIVDGDGVTESVPEHPATPQLASAVLVRDPSFYQQVLLGGTIGSAESYAEGDWESDDLTALIRIMIRNLDKFSALEKTWARLKSSWDFLQHRLRRNSVSGSRKNIHAHYDLGNDFYQLFLDPTMNYSSGIFESGQLEEADFDDLHDASVRKMEQVCRRLQLNDGDHVLEIGTGWGGLAVYMAEHYGCRVTTTTISQEQYRFAVDRVAQSGLSDRVTVLFQDYRTLEGKYNKIVSIEMIEAVGHQYYDEFFERCSNLLDEEGVMLLQSIAIGEQNYDYHIRHVDFIRKYIFPGGCLPSMTALASSVGRVTDMRMLFQQDITPHYVTTLACWRREFVAKLGQIRALGYDERFIRFWHFYFCYCEAAFAERRVHNIHVMFAKPKCQIDPTANVPPEGRREINKRDHGFLGADEIEVPRSSTSALVENK